jgi:hypothetical protein
MSPTCAHRTPIRGATRCCCNLLGPVNAPAPFKSNGLTRHLGARVQPRDVRTEAPRRPRTAT